MTAPYAHLFGSTEPAKRKPSPYASLLASSDPGGDIDLRDPVQAQQHGASGSWGDEPSHGVSGEWGDETPSIGGQIKAGAQSAIEGVRHLPSTIAGMGKSAVHDLDVVGRLVSAGMGGPSHGVEQVPTREMVTAGVNTAANAALPMIGALGLAPRFAVNAGLGAINDPEQPMRGATAGALLGETIHGATKVGGKAVAGARDLAQRPAPAATAPPENASALPADRLPTADEAGREMVRRLYAPEPTIADLAPAGERNLGVSITSKARESIRNAYRSALVTPYAAIETQAPELADALQTAGAADARAKHIGNVRVGRVVRGLTEQQRADFGTKLVYDNLAAEAERKGQIAQDTQQRATDVLNSGKQKAATVQDQAQQKIDALMNDARERAAEIAKGAPTSPEEAFNRSPGAKMGLSYDPSKPFSERIAKLFQEGAAADYADQQKVFDHAKKDAEIIQREAADKARSIMDEHTASAKQLQEEAAGHHTAAQNFAGHVERMSPRVPQGIDQQPWFQKALSQYKTDIEGPLTQDALASGVDPNSLRQPASAYVRLASDERLNAAEIRRAMDADGVQSPDELRQRPAILRKLIGENPALTRYFAQGTHGIRQGPLQANTGYPGEPGPVSGKRSALSGSSKMAQGTAQDYATDVGRIVDFDARDKAVKAARNRVLDAVSQVGRKLDEGEDPAYGKKVLAFDDKKGLVTGDAGVSRYEVTPEVADAVEHFYKGQQPRSTARQMLQRGSDFFTRAQIAGMPVEAMSHANTEASIVGSVPGEKDLLGKAIAAIPGIGGKAASIREMLTLNLSDPKTQALENRLADIGALRIEDPHEGLINTSHNFLFGETGVDKRARLVLARKLLDRNPNATNAELREFINSQVGNYNSQNAGALTNFMAKGSVLSPFARFQSARIPTSIKRTVGVSDLPASSKGARAKDIAQTLYRGPLGYAVGAGALNYALSGHGQQDNDPGHALDVNTGFVARPGGLSRMSRDEAQAQYGERAQPVYLPAATLNPVNYAGLRATGLRAMIPALSPEQPNELRGDNALRDMVNVALGTAGPMVRAGMTATMGTQPYLQSDNSLLRVVPRRMGSDFLDRVETALGMANPAVHAFTTNGGDAGRTLASAVAEDGKFMGGPASIAAKVAEFTMPRLLAPAIGGKTNEQSADVQLDRRYREAVADYSNRIKRAPGPIAKAAIIEDAVKDAGRSGFDPDVVRVALEKVAEQDHTAVAEKQQQQMERRKQKTRIVP